MRHSIDQVTVFFEGITSVWGRALVFALCCWAGHFAGAVFGALHWARGAVHFVFPFDNIALVPFSWLMSVAGGAASLLGVLWLLFVAAAFYAMIVHGERLAFWACALVTLESWRSWWLQAESMTLFGPMRGETAWLGALPLFLCSVLSGWLAWRSVRE
ncbi:hypothetical protein [Verrucomicrobium sp. BvORR034]|jgi:hypothetical protein|uniref:hypothetical protein n=1 Tax=Verrucomicrobium sp. BvORR034 TaxID=1396418 RepID=UPI0006784D2C|nr:hypothetical protein [Verrucomicrobium sp. BvORR034]